jgi:nitrite reductase/ring-hydroxylating ferredoxin subunit
VQKLADPSFFQRGGTDYIGTQLRGFSNGSPIGWFLRFAGHWPVATGAGIALLEIAIGLATLAGIGSFLAALAGCAINVALWLSATWHVHPYFLGSDSIYAVAWLAYALQVRSVKKEKPTREQIRPTRQIDRRAFVRAGLVTVATFFLGGTTYLLAPGRPSRRLALGQTAAGRSSPAPTDTAVTPSAVSGTPIIELDKLQVGQPIGFVGPGREPAALFRLSADEVVAYSRICTHAGCTVGYNSSTKLLQCPCHGALFDPAHGARVIAGPTSTPLPKIDVAIDQSAGTVVVPS